jgi:hypothetical protein
MVKNQGGKIFDISRANIKDAKKKIRKGESQGIAFHFFPDKADKGARTLNIQGGNLILYQFELYPQSILQDSNLRPTT